jgi:hypothetical protein
MAEHLAVAAVNDGNKDASTVAPAVDEGENGCPTLVGALGDGASDFDARALARTAFWEHPAFDFHEAVDFLAVDKQSITKAQSAPSSPDSASRLGLMDLLDRGNEGLVDGLGMPLAGQIVSRGAR